jgi:hypothetical protein
VPGRARRKSPAQRQSPSRFVYVAFSSLPSAPLHNPCSPAFIRVFPRPLPLGVLRVRRVWASPLGYSRQIRSCTSCCIIRKTRPEYRSGAGPLLALLPLARIADEWQRAPDPQAAAMGVQACLDPIPAEEMPRLPGGLNNRFKIRVYYLKSGLTCARMEGHTIKGKADANPPRKASGSKADLVKRGSPGCRKKQNRRKPATQSPKALKSFSGKITSDRLPKSKTSESWRHKAMGLRSPTRR